MTEKLEKGLLIKKRRKELRMSQERLAELVGVHKTTISKYELGENETMRVSTIEKIAHVLNLNPSDLLGIERTEKDKVTLDQIPMFAVPICTRQDLLQGDFRPKSAGYVGVPEHWRNYGKEYFAWKVEDNMMAPLLCREQIAVFERTDHVDSDTIGIFRDGNQILVRRYMESKDGSAWFFCDNSRYRPEKVDMSQIITLGRLVFSVSKMG